MTPALTRKIWSLTQKGYLTANEKFLLLAISTYSDKDYIAFPCNRRLAMDTGLNIKTVIKVRQSLIAKGYLRFTGDKTGFTSQVKVMQIIVSKIDPHHESSKDYIHHESPKPQPVQQEKLSTEIKPEPKKEYKPKPKQHKVKPKETYLNRPNITPQNYLIYIYLYYYYTTNYKDVGTSGKKMSKSIFFSKNEFLLICHSMPPDCKFNFMEVISLCEHHITHSSGPNYSRMQRIRGFCTLLRENRFVPPRGYVSELEREKKEAIKEQQKLEAAYQEYYSEFQHCLKYNLPFMRNQTLMTKAEFFEVMRE